MRHRSNVSPAPLTVDRDGDGIEVRYRDGRTVRYADPVPADGERIAANTAYEIHALVTDPDGSEGVMVYVNDHDTSDDILESTGVGRLLLEPGEEAAIYPGVTAARSRERITVRADPDAIDGSLYVFVENELEERAFRLV